MVKIKKKKNLKRENKKNCFTSVKFVFIKLCKPGWSIYELCFIFLMFYLFLTCKKNIFINEHNNVVNTLYVSRQ